MSLRARPCDGRPAHYNIRHVTGANRILVVQPSWVGDAVMATPMLRALRRRFPEARITYLLRRHLKPLYLGMPWFDRLMTYRTGRATGPRKPRAGKGRNLALAARLRAGKFDMAVLLPNSFHAALVCRLAGIERIVGYDRDGRGMLLTDRLLPYRAEGRFVPTPMIKSYMGLATYLGARPDGPRMELFATDADRREAADVLARLNLPPDLDRPGHAGQPPMVILNVGANFGAAKCWLPENFAAVGDDLHRRMGAHVLVSGSPKERPIVDAVLGHMAAPGHDLSRAGMTLGGLKDIVRRCDLMVTNDTGPRHIAAAFETPVVTVFGPTHPDWTTIWFDKERQVSVPVFCGPCQKKICPLDHRCMTRVTPNMVLDACAELLGQA